MLLVTAEKLGRGLGTDPEFRVRYVEHPVPHPRADCGEERKKKPQFLPSNPASQSGD